MQGTYTNRLLFAALALAAFVAAGSPASYADERPHNPHIQAADSIVRGTFEMPSMTQRMAQSAYPVQLRTVGNTVCVKSDYRQVLPVYTSSGSFYAAFRLNKGTNWLSGLPRGSYIINHRRITIV